MPRPLLVGIVNITADSFSDGGRFLDPAAAIAQARRLAAGGADIIELGAAASNIAADPVAPDEEMRRLDPVIAALQADEVAISIDSYCAETQRFAAERGVDYLNDIHGFADPAVYAALSAARCRLIVMHSVQSEGRAQRAELGAGEVWRRIDTFFAERLSRLEAAEIARERLVVDPGMGFFLSSRPEASLSVLAGLDRLKRRFGLPVMISVSRKSFLGALVGRRDPGQLGAATLAAELFAAGRGADFVRTHDPAALCEALAVMEALEAAAVPLDKAWSGQG